MIGAGARAPKAVIEERIFQTEKGDPLLQTWCNVAKEHGGSDDGTD